MKVFLKKDIERVGMAGEIIKVEDGYARNFLLPRKFAIEVNASNEAMYAKRALGVEKRKEVISSKTSMLAEKINNMKVKVKRKVHDDGKLYGAVNASEIVTMLANEGVIITKSQVEFRKSIKSKGTFEVTIKLTSRLKPSLKVVVIEGA